jgi:general L-amino acid transport system permease protein
MSAVGGEDSQMTAEMAHAIAEADRPRHGDLSPKEWVKANLFNSWLGGIFTIVFSLVSLVLAYFAIRFVLVTGQWTAVQTNLELFMIGRFPREERDRMVVNLVLYATAGGLALGWARASARDRAESAGTELVTATPRELLSSYWALAAFVLTIMIMGVRTIGPWLLLGGMIATFVVGFVIASRLPRSLRPATLTVAGLVGVCGFLALSGTGGFAWFFLTLSFVPLVSDVVARTEGRVPKAVAWFGTLAAAAVAVWMIVDRGWTGVAYLAVIVTAVCIGSAAVGNAANALRFGALAVISVITYEIGSALGVSNIDWQEWGGLYMNLLASAAAIILAFPLGLLLALGRRSTLPVVRWMSTIYIEVIRGVPLITLLLMARFFLGFFLDTDDPLSLPTRAIAAITLFSAAYIAEIVRGGLQSVPEGQTEAGQSLGLRPAGITRLLVLPQALRNVIPAMVGQFISLFKDTSLLFIIGVLEFLGVRDVVHAQQEFLSVGIAETLVFVAFGFWAVSFTMSRESQRLERNLGVGVR